MLSFIRSLKGMARSSNAVVVVTFPPSLVSPSCSKRLQHMADTLLSVRAIPGSQSTSTFHAFIYQLPQISPLDYICFRWGQGNGKTSHWLPRHGWTA